MSTTNNNFICEFCNKSYTVLSTLKNHQKTAKFCIEIQTKKCKEKNILPEVEIELFTCEYCNKDFTLKHNYNCHLTTCKEKKVVEETKEKKIKDDQLEQLNKKLKSYENRMNIYESNVTELNLKLQFKEQYIQNLEKQIESYKLLLSNKPTTVYNDNSTNKTTTTNYNIQFNQMLEKIGILCDQAVLSRLKNIPDDEIDKYNYTDITNEVSNSLTNVLKDLAFCTDSSRKTVITKNEQTESHKMDVEEFLTTCLQLGRPEINNYLDNVKMSIDDKVNDDIISEEDFNKFKPKYTEIRNFINDKNMNIKTSKNNPLKKMTSMAIHKMEQLKKVPSLVDSK